MWNDMENMEETPNSIVKRYKKYMEETQVEMWNDMENMEENFFNKTINTACNLFKFILSPTVRGNNSVSEGITL
jgi:hypothetical protein